MSNQDRTAVVSVVGIMDVEPSRNNRFAAETDCGFFHTATRALY